MTIKDSTYFVSKVYYNGLQYTSKVVGKSSLLEYLRRAADVLDDENGRVVAVTITSYGRKDEDIESKDLINNESFCSANRFDYHR